jgi:hypothetical protein
VLPYTSWRFYAFSGTNLLTRCHNASSLFSTIFVFQKSYTGNILGIGRNQSRASYFYRSFTKTEDETEGGQEPGSPQGARPSPWPCPPMVRPPGPTSDDALLPIKSLSKENPRTIGVFPRTVPQRRRCRRQILGDRSLYSGTLPSECKALLCYLKSMLCCVIYTDFALVLQLFKALHSPDAKFQFISTMENLF